MKKEVINPELEIVISQILGDVSRAEEALKRLRYRIETAMDKNRANPSDVYLGYRETCLFLDIATTTLRKKIEKGEIKGEKDYSGRWMFKKSDIIKYEKQIKGNK